MAKDTFRQMTTRQKAIIGSMVVVVLIIIWQVMSLFPSTPTSEPPPRPRVVARENANTPLPQGSPHAAPVVPDQQLRQSTTIANDPQFLKMQKMVEERYIGKLNELEDLKIQRQIAETNQAISAAKLATVTAEKDISDLLTKPAPPQIPVSAYASQLANPGQPGGTLSPPPEVQPPPKPEPIIIEYAVISVSMQMHKWSAVLGFQGKLFSVSVGDILPADGSKVIEINRNSVVLRKDGVIRRISMVSSI